MRFGIVLAFVIAGVGYMIVSWAPVLWIACLAVALAHSGGAIAWVYSTTLLQNYTDDKFRGRVFSAEFAGMMGMMAIVAWIGATWWMTGAFPCERSHWSRGADAAARGLVAVGAASVASARIDGTDAKPSSTVGRAMRAAIMSMTQSGTTRRRAALRALQISTGVSNMTASTVQSYSWAILM
jgi:hypothetical protein